jgi:hypothetical protein
VSKKFQGISYATVLYCLDIENIKFLSKESGVYVLWEGNQLYCGEAGDFSSRVGRSVKERGFGRTVFYYPTKRLESLVNMNPKQLRRYIEGQCISALHTIIYGNGIPFHLVNDLHALLLPPSAWSEDEENEYSLAIDIAQTVLHSLMVPSPLYQLPYRELLFSDIPSKLHSENTLGWKDISAAERDGRRKKDFQKGPLWCIRTD